jgi:D-beta-D-heptose 7-phosphate kinase/D-beta-D-heptose 1-phosphate adenosyltransferase
MLAQVRRLSGQRILVVGDVCVDIYHHSRIEKISCEAPVPVLIVEREERILGMAGNVALGIKALNSQPVLYGNRTVQYHDLYRSLQCPLRTDDISIRNRYIVNRHQMMRVDSNQQTKPMNLFERHLGDELKSGYGAVVVADYGKGIVQKNDLESLLLAAKGWGSWTICHARPQRFARSGDLPFKFHPLDFYKGCDVLVMNQDEFFQITGRHPDPKPEDVLFRVEHGAAFGYKNLVVTLGHNGIICRDEKLGVHWIKPEEVTEVFDPVGVRDTVLSVLSCAIAGQVPLPDACRLAQKAATLVVKKFGTAICTEDEILHAVTHL